MKEFTTSESKSRYIASKIEVPIRKKTTYRWTNNRANRGMKNKYTPSQLMASMFKLSDLFPLGSEFAL